VSIDEQELRQRLATVAAQASPPGFTIESVIGRIRRRRARIIAAVSASFLAIAAIAVAVPIGLSAPSRPTAAPHPSNFPFQLSFTVAVNGRSMVLPLLAGGGPFPSFAVTSGENLAITVDVTVPPHATVTAIWLGVAEGAFSASPAGRPTGVNAILAHSRRSLTPGVHLFRLRWTVPTGVQPGTNLALTATWSARDFTVGQYIAELFTGHASPNGSGRGSPPPPPPTKMPSPLS
jgi:hypothetical protein